MCKAEVSGKAERMKKHECRTSTSSKKSNKESPVVPVSASSVPVSTNAVSLDGQSNKQTFLYQPSDRNDKNKTQLGMRSFVKSVGIKAKEDLDKALGRFIFSANISFNVLENKQFQDFIKLINPAYQVPSHDKMGTTVLDEVFKEVRQKMEEQLRGTTGVILQDGWSSNQNESVIAHCLKSGQNTHFLSTSTPSTTKAGADYCFAEIEGAIEMAKSEFNCTIVGVVTDNCNTMVALKQLITQKYPTMEAIACAPHLFNLLGKKFTPVPLQEKVTFVQTFMKGHHFTVAALKKRKAKMPVLPGNTRWNSQIDSFLN